MTFELSLLGNALVEKQAVNEVLKCNDLTTKFGLVLTERQAFALVETRSFALKKNGRIEFGRGVIDKLIREFCDSPYIDKRNYAEILHELLEIFYYYKNETLDQIGDDDLIEYMKKSFDGMCQGSLDLLSGKMLHNLARNLRFGQTPDDSENTIEPDEEEEDGKH